MDTPEFGEVTKQKIGYRLREVLSAKKTKARLKDGPAWVYSFDKQKLKRIAKKYGCSLVPKFQTIQSSQETPTPKSDDKIPERNSIPENEPVFEPQKPNKQRWVLPKLCNLGTMEHTP